MSIQKDQSNFQKSFITHAVPHQVYRAITHKMAQWWTTTTSGYLDTVGDIVRVDFPPHFGYWVFRAEHLVPDQHIEARCIEAHHTVPDMTEAIVQEWLESRIIFHITPVSGGTQVTLEHKGLTPTLNCYNICVDGWEHFFGKSLKAFLDGGEPAPHRG